MPGLYDFEANRSTFNTALNVAQVHGSTTPRRSGIAEYVLGSEAAPADASILWGVVRVSGAVTGTSVTPSPKDPADAGSDAVALENVTSNPTLGVRLAGIPLHQKATYRWVAVPGQELICPATSNNGIGWQTNAISSGTPAVSMTVSFAQF